MNRIACRMLVTAYRALVNALPPPSREGLEEEMTRAFELSVTAANTPFWERCRAALSSFADLLRCIVVERRSRRAREQRSPHESAHRRKETVMSALVQDVRYALRLVRGRPGFVAVVVLTLGLGIGANAAVFSVVNAVLLRPLPYAEPERLALLWGRMSETEVGKAPWSGLDLLDFRERATSFEAIAGVAGFNATLTGDFAPEPVRLGWATVDFFDVLGVAPRLGRAFEEGDQQNLDPQLFTPGATPPPGVVILSHDLWKRRFGSDPEVVGTTVEVAGQSMEIVGVAPERFRLYLPADASIHEGSVDLWGAVAFDLTKSPRDAQWLTLIGRLAPGRSLPEARAEMTAIASQLRAENQFHENVGMEVEVVPMRQDVVGHTRPLLYALAAAVGFVLLIACANVANLQLVRAHGRERELAIRAALGGSRRRIAQQILVECLVLAAAGGAVGLALARGGVSLLLALRPENLPRVETVSIDLQVLVFASLATFLSAILFGALPALQSSRAELRGPLNERSGGTPARGWLRDALVVSEVAVALLLMIFAGLMIRTFSELARVDPGFEARNVLTTNVTLPFVGYGGGEDRAGFHVELKRQLESIPGVEAVGAVTPLPLGGGGHYWFGPYALHEASDEEWSRNEVDYRITLPGFVEALGIELLAGRELDAADNRPETRRAVMVDDVLAAKAWPGEVPVGERILVMRPNNAAEFERYWAEVVGVVGHVRYDDLRRDGRGTIYFPFADWYFTDLNYVVRTSVDPEAISESIRAAVRAADPSIPATPVVPLRDLVDEALAPTRFVLVVMSVFAGVAILLAAVGLYGVLSYTVRERSRELALRITFGAARRNILRLVLRRGLTLTLAGVGLGTAVAVALTDGLSSLLYGVTPRDPATYAVLAAALVGVALAACYFPARRATRVDPMETLRSE